MAEDTMREKISALVDGELDSEDAQRSIRELRGDAEYRDCWERYHMIGDALRNKLPNELNSGFAASISQAIAAEDVLQTDSTSLGVTELSSFSQAKEKEKSRQPVAKPWVGFAVAASVAAMAYVGVGMINIEEQEPRLAAVSAPAMERVAAVSSSVPMGITAQTVQGQKWVVAQPAVASKLSPYLYSHRNVTGGASINAQVISHARLVSGQTIVRGE